MESSMDHRGALDTLRRYNAWRRGEDDRTMDETGLTVEGIGQAIDVAIDCISETQGDMDNYPQGWEGGAA